MAGYVEVVRSAPDIALVGAFGHVAALAWDGDWSLVDVALVDAADESQEGDQFPGVTVVRHIRTSTDEPRPTVVVVTGHYLHDGLRHRMAEAGADFYFLRANLRSREQLVDVVMHPDNYRRGVPGADPERQRLLGLTDRSRVDDLLAYAREHQLEPALDAVRPIRQDPRERRWLRHRKKMAEIGQVEAVNVTTGDSPYRGQTSPSWRQLRRPYSCAARIDQKPEKDVRRSSP